MSSGRTDRTDFCFVTDAIAELITATLMRRQWWSPVGRRLRMIVDDSADGGFTGSMLNGIIRGYDLNDYGGLTRLLIELDKAIRYPGYALESDIRWLVAEPCLRVHRTSRLILGSWCVARLVIASSFVASTHKNSIGIARLRVVGGKWLNATFPWR